MLSGRKGARLSSMLAKQLREMRVSPSHAQWGIDFCSMPTGCGVPQFTPRASR
jgi:hypothetical protein